MTKEFLTSIKSETNFKPSKKERNENYYQAESTQVVVFKKKGKKQRKDKKLDIKICFACPTILLRRPIAEIIKQLNCDNIGLISPKNIFKKIDNSLHYSKVSTAKRYHYNTINPPIITFEWPIPLNPLFFIYLFKIFTKYDIIHMWVPFYIQNITLSIIKKIFFPNKELILTMDTIPAYSFQMGKILNFIFKTFYKSFSKIVFSAADKIVLYCKSMKEFALKARVPLNKVIYSPIGVNLKIKKKTKSIRKEFGIKNNEKIILFVGILNTRKGVDLIIKTAQKLNIKNFKVILVGDGPKRKTYQKMVKQNNLQGTIIFTGFRKDVHNFYHEADVFFLPSRGEGLAGVLLESMAYGLPIITSDIAGTRDLIKDNYNGFLCEINDINSYKKKIEILLENNKLKDKFIENSKEILKNSYNWENNIKLYENLYKSNKKISTKCPIKTIISVYNEEKLITNLIHTKFPIKVIIPVFNEENTITDLIKRIHDTFSKLNIKAEIICIDDGSSDKTREILNRSDITLLFNEKNLGKGEALKKGFRYCSPSDIIITIDADGEHCPEDIPEILKPILNGETDIVIGSRFLIRQNENGSYLDNRKYLSQMRKVGNQIFTIFGTVVTQKYITDTQSGFRAFKPNIINNLNLEASGFEIETEIIIKASDKGYKIKEVPINNGVSFRDSYMNLVLDSLKIGLTFFSGIFPKKFKFIFRFMTSKINKIR